ncbi:MAG: shikimate dehydrogenase [Hyphomicrobiales bacterium]|nr:shikimate dehydrogenase [Hyphomicrobiales bacterium]
MVQHPSGKTGMLALLAHPVDHVKGPSFMNPALEELGRDWFVTPMHVKPDDLGQVVAALRKLDNYLGVILTLPHKEAMAAMCDQLGPNGRLIGAVNAVSFAGGRLTGDMFDGMGLLRAVTEAGIGIGGRKVLLVGAGGAARAIAFAFAQEKPARLGITNRTAERSEKLANDIAAALPNASVSAGEYDASGYDVVVNCTSLGLHEGDQLPTDPKRIGPSTDVVDIIAVRETELMQAAGAKGCKVVGGVPMALGQMAEFSRFFDPDRS